MHNCATSSTAAVINACKALIGSLVSTATMPYSAPVHHGILSCGVAVNYVISRKEKSLIFSSLMHNCATFTAAVYINALQLIGSGKHRHDVTQPLFTVEYYRAAWR
jgi:hypothetical protein